MTARLFGLLLIALAVVGLVLLGSGNLMHWKIALAALCLCLVFGHGAVVAITGRWWP